MDLDARMRELNTLKARLDKLFDGGLLARLEKLANDAEAAREPERGDGPDVATMVNDLDKHVAELAETVTGLQRQLEVIPSIEQKFAALDEYVRKSPLADPSVVDLLDWLARNREGLELLLSLGDTVDGKDDSEEAPQAAETANGAGSGVTGTEAPAPAEGAQAAS